MKEHDSRDAKRVSVIAKAALASSALLALVCTVVLCLAAYYQVPMSISTQEQPEPQETESLLAEYARSLEMQAAELAVTELLEPYGDSVAVTVVSLDNDSGFSINGDERFPSASMIKLLVLAEYMQQVDEGTIDSESSYVLVQSDKVGGAGVIAGASSGTEFRYSELAQYMIEESDNTATNILIDTLGMDSINDSGQELGLAQTELKHKMMLGDGMTENRMSSNDAASLLRGIAQHAIASESASSAAESYLLMQADTEGLAQGLPLGIEFGHKTGSLDTARHDGGIVYSENPYVIVVLTSLEETSANELMAAISSLVFETLG